MALWYTRGSAACSFLMLQRLLLLLTARLWLPGSRCASEGRWGSSKPSSPRAPIQQAAITVLLLAVASSKRAGEPHRQLYPHGSNGISAFRSNTAHWAGLEMFVLHLEMCQWIVAAPSTGVAFSKENQTAPWTYCLSSFIHMISVLLLIWKGWIFQEYLYSLPRCSGPLTSGAWVQMGWTPRTAQWLVGLCCSENQESAAVGILPSLRENRSRFKYRHAHAETQVEEKVKMRSRTYRHGIIKALINDLGFTLNHTKMEQTKERCFSVSLD